MAYRNMNGEIAIDDGAARADINKIQSAIGILEGSKAALKAVINESETMKGDTPDATADKAREMLKEVEALIKKLKEAQGYIKTVVAKYKAIDEKYAAKLAAAANKKGE